MFCLRSSQFVLNFYFRYSLITQNVNSSFICCDWFPSFKYILFWVSKAWQICTIYFLNFRSSLRYGDLKGTFSRKKNDKCTLGIFSKERQKFNNSCFLNLQMHEMVEGETKNPVAQFILQNLGLLLGWAIMLVLSLFEDKIKTSIS